MYIYAGRSTSLKNNVRTVVETMGWNTPTFCDKGKDGYKCKWGGRNFVQQQIPDYFNLSVQDRRERYQEAKDRALDIIEDIKDRTGINVYLNRADNLVIPFYYDDRM